MLNFQYCESSIPFDPASINFSHLKIVLRNFILPVTSCIHIYCFLRTTISHITTSNQIGIVAKAPYNYISHWDWKLLATEFMLVRRCVQWEFKFPRIQKTKIRFLNLFQSRLNSFWFVIMFLKYWIHVNWLAFNNQPNRNNYTKTAQN